MLHDGVREGRRTFGNVIKYIMMGTSSNFGNMFSMAGGTLLLPFLPMLPTQILLNNFLYDLSEVAIPIDNVDEDAARAAPLGHGLHPQFHADHRPDQLAVRLSDLLRHARCSTPGRLFHTGWFIESLATQVLVIFIIRTQGNPFTNRPNLGLALLSLAVVAIGAALPFTPAGEYLGLVQPPAALYLALVGIVTAYLVVVQVAKQAFYRSSRARMGIRPA